MTASDAHSATTPPGEGHRTGTGAPDAPGASEAAEWDRLTEMNLADLPKWEADLLDRQAARNAAIQAATRALEAHGDISTLDGSDWWGDGYGGDTDTIVSIALEAAEPILRQALAEDIARRIEVLEDYEAAEIAREVGRGE